jgi:4'-phosphopantetheinyl transferase EntD
MPDAGCDTRPALPVTEALHAALGCSDLICLLAPITDKRADLTPAESQTIHRAVSKRQMEYATGRWLARQALARYALGDSELLAAGDRQPQWPAAVVGSITHSAGYAAVD